MRRFAITLQAVAMTLWVGALWTAGLIVAPLLFSTLSDRALAGSIAGRLFATTAWIGIGCAALLILCRWACHRGAAFRQPALWIVLAMLVLTLAGEFGVQPVLADLRAQALPQPVMESAYRDSFAYWHGVAGILYAANCLLGGAWIVLQALRPDKYQ